MVERAPRQTAVYKEAFLPVSRSASRHNTSRKPYQHQHHQLTPGTYCMRVCEGHWEKGEEKEIKEPGMFNETKYPASGLKISGATST